jgi:hypothetical protein
VKGRKTQTTKGKNERIQIQQEICEVYERGNTGVPGERECKREKFTCGNEERENRYLMEGERRCRMCYEERKRDN